jgi:Tfp pilus assembly protein PilF
MDVRGRALGVLTRMRPPLLPDAPYFTILMRGLFMLGSFVSTRLSGFGIGFSLRGVLVCTALSSWLALPVVAQVTTETLIGDSVAPEELTKHPDVDEAIKRFSNRDVLGARQFLETAKRKAPKLPPTDLILAKLYFLSNDAAAGRNALEATVADNPNDPEVYLILADQFLQSGQSIAAEALYDKALQLIDKFSENPKRKRNFELRARNGRAAVAARRKNWASMIADLQALLRTDQENAKAHYLLGQALFMQAKSNAEFKAGYEEFVAAKRLDKNLPNPFVAAALMYDQLNKQGEAQQAFDRAVAEDKSSANTLSSYAQWLIKTGSVEKAESVLATARTANPNSLEVLILSGVAARMAKKMKPAEDYFLDALRIAPSNGVVLNQLALLLIEQGDDEKKQRALQFAGINAKLNSENPEAQVTLSWVLYQLGRMADADAAFRDGMRLGMGNLTPDSSYLVAKMLVDQKRGDQAKTILTAALNAENQGIFINRSDAQALLNTVDNL